MRKNDMSLWRITAIVMAALMIVTYMPLLTDSAAYAAKDEIVYEDVELPEKEVDANKAKAVEKLEDKLGIDDGSEEDADEAEPAEVEAVMETDAVSTGKSKRALVLKSGDSGFTLDANGANGIITVSKPNKYGKITVKGVEITNPKYIYTGIWIGDDHPDKDANAKRIVDLNGTTLNKTVDMRDFEVGYHTIYVTIKDIESENDFDIVDYVTYVPTNIYKKATNSINWYQTSKKYMTFYYGGSTYYSYSGEYLDVYMDYKKAGKKKWSTKVYGPVSTSSYSLSKKSGLRPNTTYYVRMMYGKKCKYNGETSWFTGRLTGKASSKKKLMTAYRKPKFKKITITNGKTIVNKYKVHYADRYKWRVYSNGYRQLVSVTPLYHTYRYYYTKYKVNVYFKKKQKIAGIEIKTGGGTVRRTGNKKKYSAKYKVSGRKKGKKIGVKVRCFRSKTYGGYSSWRGKKVKVRK